ncbi:MAG: endonuclease domain-containing protein [Hyphomonas sp.]
MVSASKTHRSRELRRHMPPAEKAVWWHLRSPLFKPYHFRRQAPAGPYFADFISHRMKLVIEIDGDTHTEDKDARRDAWFAERGYETLRIPNSDVYDTVDGVMETILARLRYIEQTKSLPRATPPHPSP